MSSVRSVPLIWAVRERVAPTELGSLIGHVILQTGRSYGAWCVWLMGGFYKLVAPNRARNHSLACGSTNGTLLTELGSLMGMRLYRRDASTRPGKCNADRWSAMFAQRFVGGFCGPKDYGERRTSGSSYIWRRGCNADRWFAMQGFAVCGGHLAGRWVAWDGGPAVRVTIKTDQRSVVHWLACHGCMWSLAGKWAR